MTSGYVLSDEVIDHKINEPAFSRDSSYRANKSLNDLDLFTKGQPIDFYKELRERTHQSIFMILCQQILNLDIGY